MLYNKITPGFVIQVFNDQGQCLSQEFVAKDEVEFETEDGCPINRRNMPFGGEEYFPYEMKQPE